MDLKYDVFVNDKQVESQVTWAVARGVMEYYLHPKLGHSVPNVYALDQKQRRFTWETFNALAKQLPHASAFDPDETYNLYQ